MSLHLAYYTTINKTFLAKQIFVVVEALIKIVKLIKNILLINYIY